MGEKAKVCPVCEFLGGECPDCYCLALGIYTNELREEIRQYYKRGDEQCS